MVSLQQVECVAVEVIFLLTAYAANPTGMLTTFAPVVCVCAQECDHSGGTVIFIG